MKRQQAEEQDGKECEKLGRKEPGAGGGVPNQPPADKKQGKDLAGLISSLLLLLPLNCSIALSLSVCVRLLSLFLRIPSLFATCHCCRVKQESRRRRDWGCGLVGSCREAKVTKCPSFNLRRGHGRGCRVGRGEWQQFLCSCRGGALDPQTRVGLQRVCESGSQSGPCTQVPFGPLCCPGTTYVYLSAYQEAKPRLLLQNTSATQQTATDSRLLPFGTTQDLRLYRLPLQARHVRSILCIGDRPSLAMALGRHVLCCLPVIRHIIWFNTRSGLS